MASRALGASAFVLLLAAGAWAFSAPAAGAQPAKPKVKPAKPAPAPAVAEESGRYLVQVLAMEVSLHEGPRATEPVIARAEQGTYFEADARAGDWYRVRRARGGYAWILDTALGEGRTVAVSPWPGEARIEYGAVPPDGEGLERRRPQGIPLEPRLPLVDPARVSPPTALALHEEIPVRDRWRIVKSLGLMPYNKLDPYNPNVLKGDLPVLQKELGEDWFFNLTAVSDTLIEARRLPTPVGLQSTQNPGSSGTFGDGRQTALVETAIVSLSLIKGNTTFRPPDYEFRFVPVANFNRVMTEEVRAVNINPARGPDRNDSFLGVQELFIDKHLRDVSVRYDFDSVRFGIQPFSADFRGFLFLDQPFGVRLFGTRDNNQWQYNAAWFRRLEKDTNSGLNDVTQSLRADDVYVFNLYRQDWPVLGHTAQGIILHNRNREGDEGQFYNNNGFLERPAVFGSARPRNYDVTYLGFNGDGHFGRWNLTSSLYYAVGDEERGSLSGRPENIGAFFGAFELSRDFDWIRLRLSGAWASGDKDPFDGKAGGFDAVLENPLFAGADTSYWIRQAVPFIGGGGVTLSIRNGMLASLRTSREHGQSNFTNPGLHLLGIGADFDVSPRTRIITNVNYLEFDNLSSLAALRNQRLTSSEIGVDVSAGIQYRPFFTQNIVINASVAALLPGKGLKEIYGDAVDGTQYSALLNLLLTF